MLSKLSLSNDFIIFMIQSISSLQIYFGVVYKTEASSYFNTTEVSEYTALHVFAMTYMENTSPDFFV